MTNETIKNRCAECRRRVVRHASCFSRPMAGAVLEHRGETWEVIDDALKSGHRGPRRGIGRRVGAPTAGGGLRWWRPGHTRRAYPGDYYQSGQVAVDFWPVLR